MMPIGRRKRRGTAVCACVLSLVLCGTGAAQQSHAPQRYQVKHIASVLFQLLPLTEPLKLEEANRIPLILYGGRVYSTFMTVSYFDDKGELGPQAAAGSVTVHYDGSGHAYIEVTPERVGKVQLRVSVFFNDGTMDAENLDGDVSRPKTCEN
ncbi:MAG TPA: hypothetical protein VME18_08225 [Acidobacteriaceae bacterium]|nr:hypothetical protein [Acidobacteriaceae bacterium]